jgi:hypothetical protein
MLASLQTLQEDVRIGLFGRVTLGKFQSSLEVFTSLRLVQPPFVVRHHRRRANQPDSRFPLFDENLPAGKLFAQRDLTVGADDLDAYLVFNRAHVWTTPLPKRTCVLKG